MQMIALSLLLIGLAAPAEQPGWQRNIEDEGCAEYAKRMSRMVEVDGELVHRGFWPSQYCTAGPYCNRGSAASKNMRPYFYEHRHKCSCPGATGVPLSSIKKGEIHPCWGPVPPTVLFEDGFESGDLTAWDNVIGSQKEDLK